MKLNSIFIFNGTIILTTLFFALNIVPNQVKAEELHLTVRSSAIAQLLKRPSSVLENLNLTTEQQQKVLEIMKEMRPRIESVMPHPELTEEQKKQLASGQSVQITLTPPTNEQKAKMQEIMQSFRQKLESVLTPEQQQKLTQNEKEPFLLAPSI
jgi:Spy/CpxP family protein refolding chaperone